MNRLKHISIVVLGVVLLLFSEDAFAQKYYDQTYRPAFHRTKSKDGFNVRGFSFGVGAIYYFGDADASRGEGFANSLTVIKDMTIHDIGASAFFAYHIPLTDHFGLRAGADLGFLQGNNRRFKSVTDSLPGYTGGVAHREFMSAFLQPNIGVDIYPIEQYGLVIHFGIAATASFFLKTNYEGVSDEELASTTFSVLPMGQFSIGYNWNLTTAWRIGVFGAFKMGFMDMKNVNLDRWPVRPTNANSWPDGYFEIGVTVNHFQRASLPFFKQ